MNSEFKTVIHNLSTIIHFRARVSNLRIWVNQLANQSMQIKSIENQKLKKKIQHISNILTNELNYIPSDKKLVMIESFLYETYQKNQKSKIYQLNDLNNKKTIVDGLKIDYLTALFPFGLDKVEVRKSPIAGNGLFAKKKIIKDELITFYPGDIIEYTPNADRHMSGCMVAAFSSKRFKKQFGDVSLNDNKYRDNNYAFVVNKHYTIIGCPYFKENADYLGHFINDSMKCESDAQSDIVNYVYASTSKSNCTFYRLKDLHVAIIATKNIEIDEELLTTYGPGYWDSHNKEKDE